MNRRSDSKPHVVVLGGGLSGLAAAEETLAEQDCRVTVLEMEDRPGGQARSIDIGGITTDLGPHRIHSTIPEMRDWFRAELGDRLIEVQRRSRMFFRGLYLQYPPSARELLSVFKPSEMVRFGVGYASARARALAGRLPPDSFAHVMERSFGRPLCEALVFPYIRKTWKEPPEGISADAARVRATMGGAARIARRMLFPSRSESNPSTLRRFHYVRGGIENLSRTMAENVRSRGGEIVCDARVTGLEVKEKRVVGVKFMDPEGSARSLDADFIFSTIPLTDVARMTASERGRVAKSAREAARGLHFLNLFLAFVTLKRDRVSSDHWLYFPESNPSATRAYEPKNFDARLGPQGHTLLCIEKTAWPDDSLWWSEDAKLGRKLAGDLSETGLFTMDDVEDISCRRLENAYPVYLLDYAEKRATILQELSALRNLITLGRQGLFQHNNMDHAIHTGIRAAKCRRESEDPVRRWHAVEIPRFRDFRIVD